MTASTTRDARAALLEQRLRRRTAASRPTVPVRPDGVDPPLSYQQERVWFMEQFAPGTSAYSIPIPVRLRGPLDVGLLRQALDALPARHEALRMRFPADADGRPRVELAPPAPVPLDIVPAPDEATARALVDAAATEPFDLVRGPLLRALLVRLGPEDHLLSVGTHHIVGDGWSTDLLLRDLAEVYRAGGATSRLPDAPVRYGDFARWQRETLTGPRLDRELEHWTGHLRGVPPLELPIDRPRPATQTFDGDWHVVTLDRELTDGIARLSRAHSTTQFMTLLAAYQVLLSRWSGQDDFVVGSSSAGRPLPELEGVVGMFVNMLPLRAQLAGDPTFAELLERTRGVVLDAFEHQDVPFERLVHALGVPRDVSRSPVFQAMFVLQNYEMGRFAADDDRGGLDFRWVPTELRSTRFDLELHVVEVEAGLRAKFVFNTALFEPATVARMAGQLEALLRSAVAGPDRPVSTVDILGPDERALVLDGFNDTTADFPAGATLPGLIQDQVARTPDAVAVSLDGRTLTYGELNARANRVAHRLRGLGVGPETLVGICAERSPELVAGLLGVLKAGGAYVPLDPDYPVERLSFMLSDADAPILLVQESLRDLLPGTRTLALDDPAEWSGEPTTDLADGAGPGNTAYVIYTSGSTGRPKGVANTHRAVVNRLDWMQRTYGLDGSDAVLQKTPASFDVSVWEFFWPLLTGARLVLARPGGHKDAGYLRDVLVAESITTAHFVPSMLTVFLAEDGIEACRALRRVVCSGEELPVGTAQRFLSRLPDCELHNLYGPTEAAIDVSSWRCTPAALAGRNTVPIGAPIQNLRLYVLDAHGDPTPVGVPGELRIGGVGVARGYHRRPALTAEKFVPDPYGGEPGARLYRTGDLARWRPDGTVEFLGRIDSQVKLRGLRIELGEIETTLLAQPGVARAAVVVREDTPGDQRLAGYLVPAAGVELDPAALRTALKTTLPDHMVPAALVPLDALPLTPNGKLDRKALPVPTTQRSGALVDPSTDTERMLAAIWQDVLTVPRIGVDDDFFDLGGHSMLATQTVARIRRESSGRPVGVMDVFAHRTIRELAAFIDAAEPEGPRRLLHELTKPIPAGQRTLSYVCFPYGGGSAIVYQPLADALPAGHALFSVAIPGHDVGLSEDGLPFAELVDRLAAEILERVDGPLAVYGHCGVGNALAVGVARKLEASGRELEVVYIAAIFPFARLKGVVGSVRARFERWRSNQSYADWLKGMGVDIRELDPEQADRIISTMRADSEAAEDYFSTLLDRRPEKLRAPIVSVVGSADPVTDYYAERYLEWQFLSDTVGLVVLDEAGHFFLKYRADELAEIVTTVHPALTGGGEPPVGADGGWSVQGTAGATAVAPVVRPSMGRFVGVTLGQLVSTTGSALTAFAVPIYLYTRTGSVSDLGFLWALTLLCGVLTLPVAGAVVDRADRRRVMIGASLAGAAVQLALALLLWSGHLEVWYVYLLLPLGSVANSVQRLAYQSAIPQLVPKQFLGHAMGLAQLSNGSALLLMPVFAAGLLAAIHLTGILIVDVVSYAFAVLGLLLVRFPDLLGWRPREPVVTAIANGLRYSWRHRGFRAMLLYFAVSNVFLAPALVLSTPLVLAFGDVGDLARVALAEAVGAVGGASVMAVWGGPRNRRMIGVLVANLGIAAGCVVTGLRPSLLVIMAGTFVMAAAMTLAQGIYSTLVQVKVPQRFHGRVFSLNQAISWSTLPVGFALLGPWAVSVLEPLLRPGGALAGSVGAVVGTGAGRGTGFAFVVFGALMAVVTASMFGVRLLRRFDTEVPDSLPDDLVGAQERQRRRAEREQVAA